MTCSNTPVWCNLTDEEVEFGFSANLLAFQIFSKKANVFFALECLFSISGSKSSSVVVLFIVPWRALFSIPGAKSASVAILEPR